MTPLELSLTGIGDLLINVERVNGLSYHLMM